MAKRIDLVAILILAAALAARLFLANTFSYIHDEENTAIPLSKTISFTSGNVNLPLRGENHGAMPAYFVKASAALFGTTPVGYRLLHLIVGLLVIVLVYLTVRSWYGTVAARWAAALLAFNEYYLTISSRATAHVPHLFFVVVAVAAFSQFLRLQRAWYLYAAAVSVGLAFYCKEHSALLLPVFFATLLHPQNRRWLRSPHVYLAAALYAAVLAPDLLWNLRTDPHTATVTYNNQTVGQATYWAHLQRIGGLGFSPYAAMFYARQPVKIAYASVTGSELRDETPEYYSMNPTIGVVLLAAVAVTTFAAVPRDGMRTFLLILAWGVFGFFTLIKRGNPPFRLDPVSWMWVEVTIVPAVMLAGARLASLTSRRKAAAWTITALALAYAVSWVLLTAE
jgi:4-amino-4-deoxy-L-arabinose transferase-like glycosyltransferase